VIERHYPELVGAESPYSALLEAVITRQAHLIAQWQLIGFIHGVMNTDNMLVSGETIDYGPCAFMDRFNPNTVYSSIDHMGRYAYRNQPGIAHWNLARFAQAILPLLAEDQTAAIDVAQTAINRFPERFLVALQQNTARKLGLSEHRPEDEALIEDLFTLMTEHDADFTLTFRRSTELALELAGVDEASRGPSVREVSDLPEAFGPWRARWEQRFSDEAAPPTERAEAMRTANPAFIPRNHLIEAAIQRAVEHGDFEPFHRMVDVLAQPFEYDPAQRVFATPPRPEEEVQQTFCGT